MRLLPVSAIAVLASLVSACTLDPSTTEASSSVTDPSTASADAPAPLRGPPLFADLVLVDGAPTDAGALPADAPHVRVPLLLPPPPKDGAAAKPCVVLRGEALTPPKDGPPPGPPPGAAGPPSDKAAPGLPKAEGLDGIDDSLASAKGKDDAVRAEKPGPTVVQIAVFDEAPPLPTKGDAAGLEPPPKDAGPRPVAVAVCVLAPDADPRALPAEVLSDLLSGSHPSGAVAHIAVAHLPPPPKDGADAAPPPPEGAAPAGDADSKKGPPPPPPVRGTLHVVPLASLAKGT